MAKLKFKLEDGIKVEDVTHKDVVICEPNAGDIMEASEASESLVQSADGEMHLVMSPSKMGRETLRRQIVSIGTLEAPISQKILGKLTALDFAIVQSKVDQLDKASLKALQARGRADGASKDLAPSH